MSKKLDIVFMIPLYKERENCQLLTEKILEVMGDSLSSYSFRIFYMIAGDDGTTEYVDSLHDPRVTYEYEGAKPTGLGNAYHIGYRKAVALEPRMIISMDGDLNHDPKLLPDLIREFETGKYDGVIASRYIKGGGYEEGIQIPYYKRFLSYVLNLILSVMMWFWVKDKTTGYRLLSHDCVASMLDEPKLPRDFAYLMYVYFLYKRAGYTRFKEIPQIHMKRINGESKFDSSNAIKSYIDVMSRIARTYFHI